jgi:hypothetical protein
MASQVKYMVEQVILAALRLAGVAAYASLPPVGTQCGKVGVKVLEHGKVLEVSAGRYSRRVPTEEVVEVDNALESLTLEVTNELLKESSPAELELVLLELEVVYKRLKALPAHRLVVSK